MAVQRTSTTLTLWLILLAVGLLSVLPFFWIIAGSFKSHSAIQSGKVLPWEPMPPSAASTQAAPVSESTETAPKAPVSYLTLNNYKQIFQNLSGLPTFYLNTVYLAAAGTFLSLLVGTLAAYGFAVFQFRGNKLLFTLLLLTIMIPGEVTLIGRYELMFHLRLYDKIAGLLIAYTAGNLLLVIFIMRNVFASVPSDLIDAAMIDGASSWQVFWQIMVPIGKNGIAACGILTFLDVWNEFLFALTFTSKESVRTLPVGIDMLKSQWGLMDSGVLFATVLLSFLPIIIVFILLQKYFISGLSAGALKG